jgi:hypothetical protein
MLLVFSEILKNKEEKVYGINPSWKIKLNVSTFKINVKSTNKHGNMSAVHHCIK